MAIHFEKKNGENVFQSIFHRIMTEVGIVLIILMVLFFLVFAGVYLIWPSILPSSQTLTLEAALSADLKLLTILVAIVALFSGYLSFKIEGDWRKFEREQEIKRKKLEEKISILKETQEDFFWLEEHIKNDPLLNEAEDRRKLYEFANKFLIKCDIESKKNYLTARAYSEKYDEKLDEKKENLLRSIEFFNRALDAKPLDETIISIYHGKGKTLVGLGDETQNKNEKVKYYKEAIQNFEKAFEFSKQTFAFSLNSQGNAYLKLSKISENAEQIRLIEEGLGKFDQAISVMNEHYRGYKWRDPGELEKFKADFHLDKARAHALRNDDTKNDVDIVKEEIKKVICIDKSVIEPKVIDEDFKSVKDIYDFIVNLIDK